MAEVHRYDRGRTLQILQRAELTTPQLATLEVLGEPKTVSSVAGDSWAVGAGNQPDDRQTRSKKARLPNGALDRSTATHRRLERQGPGTP